MFGLGAPELVIILVLVVLIFGAGKIPELGRGIGEGINNFKRGLKEGNDDLRDIRGDTRGNSDGHNSPRVITAEVSRKDPPDHS